MEDKRNLDDLIKSSFDRISKGAPDSLWGKLSSSLDSEAESPQSTEKDLSHNLLDTKVKESFSSLNGKVPRHVWTAINRQLNIEKVWKGISSELDKTKPLFWSRTWTAAAVLLLLLLSTGTFVLLSKDAVIPEIADGPEKGISKTGESIIAFGSKEDIEGGDKAKEQKARTFSLPAILEKESIHTFQSAAAKDNFDKRDRKKGFEEENNAFHQKKKFHAPKENGSIGYAKESFLFISKQGSTLVSPSVSLIGNTPEDKKLSDNSSYAKGATKDLNESPSQIVDETKNFTLGTAVELSKKQLSTNNILSLKVNSLPIIPEENTILPKVETTPLDTLPVQQTALEPSQDKNEGKVLNIRNFEAGPVWVYHNSWLLNNETRNSFDENSLISTAPTYKQNWGLTFNYNLPGIGTLATEVHFINKVGQQYKMYREGEYLKKELELQYRKIYIQYQRNLIKRGKGIPSWFTVKAGVYGGTLQEKLGEIRQEESRYASFDYGFRLALGQENKLGRITLGYGLSTERGLKNVFMGTERLPATYNKTYIQNFGTYLNVRYAF